MKGLVGVICDWAGTTVDFGSLSPVAAFMGAFESEGFAVSVEEIRPFMGMLKIDHTRKILDLVKERFKEQFGRYPDESDVARIYGKFEPSLLSCVAEYAKPIRGAVELMEYCKVHGIRLGSTTGYNRPMMEVVAPAAAKHGYAPECWVCPEGDLPGRPAPFLVYENCKRLGIYPLRAMIKVGDTVSDVQEGLNAGMWSVGLALSGNETGLSQEELEALSPVEYEAVKKKAYDTLKNAGAHYVIDGVWGLLPVLAEIEGRIAAGERP